MNRYLLPCSCGARIKVTAGQAGDQVSCPACGLGTSVPRLGALRQLQSDTRERSAAGRWTVSHACGLAGLALAVIAGLAAIWLRSSNGVVVDESMIRTAVAAMPIAELHRAWPLLKRGGIARPLSSEEEKQVRMARSSAAIERVLWLAAVAGVTLAAGGGLSIAAANRRLHRGDGA